MTKPVTIPNTFATATTAIPLSQLDSDFSTVATALNDANTYSNYAADTGVANAYVVTLSGVSTTYSAGLRIQFKAGAANTGASTLNVNGGGTKNITFQDASALSSGTIAANAIVDVMYDGTQFLLMNDPAGATGGDVVGPASATDNAIVRFDGATGKLVQNSVVTIADSTGDVAGVGALTASGNVTLSGGTANGVLYLNGSKVATSGSALTFDGTTFQYTGAANFATSSGNVGIGTSSPAGKLHVAGQTRIQDSASTSNYILIGSGANAPRGGNSVMAQTGSMVMGTEAASNLVFITNAAEAGRFDSSGNLGLGVTPSGGTYPALEFGALGIIRGDGDMNVASNAYFNAGWKYKNNGTATLFLQTSGQNQWYTAPSGTAGTAVTWTQAMTLDASGRLLVGLTSGTSGYNIEAQAGSAGTGIRASNSGGGFVAIEAESNATSNGVVKWTNDLKFVNSSGSERARITSGGDLLVGTTSATNSPTTGVQLVNGGAGGGVFIGHPNGVASGNYYATFAYNSGIIGSITQDGTTAVLFNTTSDQRLKENICDAEDAATLIDSIKVRQYDWKSDGSHQRYGFVAQELLTVAPEAVHQPADPDEMMAVDYSKLVPMLVKEIQSLRQRVALLEGN